MKSKDGFKFVSLNDVMHLPDLILRWPFHPHVKICKEIFKNKLHTYLIIREFVNNDNEIQYEISKLPTKYMTHTSLCSYFSAIVFVKKQIDAIESKKKHYSLRSISKSMNTLESCTIENINKYAPQFAYVLYKYSNKVHIDKFIEKDVINEINSDRITLYNCLKDDRKSWILPNSQIWPTTSPYHFRKTRRKTKDLSQVIQFCEQQKKAGITDKRALARLVDDFFPGFLTNAELGGLIPAREGTEVSHHAKVKQGKRLRGII